MAQKKKKKKTTTNKGKSSAKQVKLNKQKKGNKKNKPKAKPKTKPKAKSTPKQSQKKSEKKKPEKIIHVIKRKITKEFRGLIIVIVSILALLVLFYLVSVVIVFSLYNTVLPGTSVAGVDISSLTLDEVQNKLMERGQPFLEANIPVVLDGETQNFTPKELGISLLPRNTLQEVDFVDFKNTNLATIIASMFKGREIPFYVSVDINKAQKNIEERFSFYDKKSKDAYLIFEGSQLTIVPESHGKIFNTRALYKDIKTRANNLSSEPITVQLLDHNPLVTQTELEAQMETIEDRYITKFI